jgi:hypothetical protein
MKYLLRGHFCAFRLVSGTPRTESGEMATSPYRMYEAMRLRKRHLTVLYKGDPAGIAMPSELLRAEGLTAKRQPSEKPLVPPLVWEEQHEAIESYGTDLDVSGTDDIYTKAAAAVSKFNEQYGGAAQASVVD